MHYFSIFCSETSSVDTRKNRLNKAVLMCNKAVLMCTLSLCFGQKKKTNDNNFSYVNCSFYNHKSILHRLVMVNSQLLT